MKFIDVYNLMLDLGADEETELVIGQVETLDPVTSWEIAFEHETNQAVLIPNHEEPNSNVIHLPTSVTIH